METKYENIKELIVSELNTRAPDLKCPMCSTRKFALGGGYFAHDLQVDLNQRQMGGINIPTVPVICENCGYVMEFSIGKLGLLPKNDLKPKRVDIPDGAK